MDNADQNRQIMDFLFELGTLRKVPRVHQQMLLSQDLSDNIATHTFRVTMIAWFLAKMEQADPYKSVIMALIHDIGEVRSGDHNYVHKKYVKIFEDEISRDQMENLPFPDLFDIHNEYEDRKSQEAIIAKDADLLDQILLLKEYAHQGNKEAEIWLYGKGDEEKVNVQFKNLKTKSAQKLGKSILKGDVAEWWKKLWTNHNR